jgi:HEPN domain-containing protein
MAQEALILKFLRAAKQRLTSAELLLKADMGLDSTYLARYAVECSLKALLLARTPKRSWPSVEAVFQGRGGHNLERLKARLQQRGVSFDRNIVQSLRVVSTWNTDLRYEVGKIPRDDALRFVAAVREILKWAEQTASP